MTPPNGAQTPRRPEALWYGVFLLALGALPLLIVHLVDIARIAALPVDTPAAADAQQRSVQAVLLVVAYLTAIGLTVTGRKAARIVGSALAGFAVFGSAVSIGDALNYATLYGVTDATYAFAAGTALALTTIGLVLLFQASVNTFLVEATEARRRARAAALAERNARTGRPLYMTGAARRSRR